MHKQKGTTDACIWTQGFAAVHVSVSKFAHNLPESIRKKTLAAVPPSFLTAEFSWCRGKPLRYQDV